MSHNQAPTYRPDRAAPAAPLTSNQKNLIAELKVDPATRAVQFGNGKAFVVDVSTRKWVRGGRLYAERTVRSLLALGHLVDDNGNSAHNAHAYWLHRSSW